MKRGRRARWGTRNCRSENIRTDSRVGEDLENRETRERSRSLAKGPSTRNDVKWLTLREHLREI